MTRLFLSLFAGISAALLLLLFTAPWISSHWHAELAQDIAIGQARGVPNTLEALLAREPMEDVRELMESAFRDSNVPLTLGAYDAAQEPALSPGEMHALNPDDFLFHYRTLDGEWRMVLGPVVLPPEVAWVKRMWLAVLFIWVGLGCLVWIWWLYRKIRRLEQNTLAFAAGDLAVRAPTGMPWRLGSLNEHFNTMAARIGRLILSHKNLTNAVAHELRSPIFRMRFRLDTLEHEQEGEARTEALSGTRDDLDELENLVDELLEHARLERMESGLPLTEVDLRQWLTVEFPRMKSQSLVPLQLSMLRERPCMVNVDMRLLARALDNLVRNAATCARSQVQLTLKGDAAHALIQVDDDGPGVPEVDRERIFEPFVRLDQSRTRSTGGHGLGLTIVRDAIRLMGGEIRVADSPLGGARFTVVLPLLG